MSVNFINNELKSGLVVAEVFYNTHSMHLDYARSHKEHLILFIVKITLISQMTVAREQKLQPLFNACPRLGVMVAVVIYDGHW